MITKELIIEKEKELLESLKNSNVEKIDELLHDELLFIIPNGQTITKSIDLEAYRTGNMIVNSILSSEQLISIVDDTAIVSVRIELEGKYYEQLINGSFRYLRVWKFVNSKLKVIAGSCIPL